MMTAGNPPVEMRWRTGRETVTAVVGQLLAGVEEKQRRRNGRRVVDEIPRTYGVTVLAIRHGGGCSEVITDDRPGGERLSAWSNPILAGVPEFVRFADGSTWRPTGR
jgi:hypothetical protein